MRTELQCDAQSLHSDRWLSLRQAAMQSTRGEHTLHKPAQNQIKNTVKFKNTWVTGLIVSVMVVELGLDCSQSSVDCTCTEMSGVSAGKKPVFMPGYKENSVLVHRTLHQCVHDLGRYATSPN